MKILVFGNILFEKDNLALKLISKLQRSFPKIEFKEFDPTENLEKEIENKCLNILDVAEGISKVKVLNFNDIGKLEIIKSCSMHDFDLAYNLKLLKKIKKLKNVKIIAVPIGMDIEKAFNQTQLILRKCVAQDMHGS